MLDTTNKKVFRYQNRLQDVVDYVRQPWKVQVHVNPLVCDTRNLPLFKESHHESIRLKVCASCVKCIRKTHTN